MPAKKEVLNMNISKDETTANTPKKYKYSTRKQHVRLTIVDDASQLCDKEQDSMVKVDVPLYDGHTPKTDPFGSYTGVSADPYEVPVQDVDDL